MFIHSLTGMKTYNELIFLSNGPLLCRASLLLCSYTIDICIRHRYTRNLESHIISTLALYISSTMRFIRMYAAAAVAVAVAVTAAPQQTAFVQTET